ncbi:hypothetical protein HAX54_042306 [Datura stramonium]|uniref:Uncharacterized protein n=1 Tax=Datura stramonium TaxID=4076 RepID=A0ABS8W2Z9_DATST|nr:hypothetical protein [Datura stramonium]
MLLCHEEMNKKIHTLIYQRIDEEMFEKVSFYETREKAAGLSDRFPHSVVTCTEGTMAKFGANGSWTVNFRRNMND